MTGRERLAEEVAKHIAPPGFDHRTRPEVLLVLAIMDLTETVHEDARRIRDELQLLRGQVQKI